MLVSYMVSVWYTGSDSNRNMELALFFWEFSELIALENEDLYSQNKEKVIMDEFFFHF